MRHGSRLASATALLLALLALVPMPSGAAPTLGDTLDSALGDAGSALPGGSGQTNQAPSVSVSGGGLPPVTVGGGSGTQPPSAGGGGASTPSAPSSASQPSTGGQGASTPSSGVSPGTTTAAPRTSQRSASTAGSSSTRSSSGGHDSGVGTSANKAGATESRQPAKSDGGQAAAPSLASRIVNRIPPEYRAAMLALAAIAVLLGLLSLRESRRSRRAQEDALADPLTGLPNRHAFEERMEREWTRAKRYERELGLLLIDLDDFKEVNDTRGHLAGDRVLRETAAVLTGRIREVDFAARLGGDEFVVVCPETGQPGLQTLAAGLERALAEHDVSASVGVGQREPADGGSADLISRADTAMYERKRHRRLHAGAADAAFAAARA